MENILEEIKKSCIKISSILNDYSSFELSLELKKLNNSGDKVKKIDSIANNIFLTNLQRQGNIKYICSEEEDKFIDHNNAGRYIVCYDPLDGSSNIKTNITTGSIFGIYKYDESLNKMKIVCSGYCLYGASTQLVIARDSVNIYQLRNKNKFILVCKNFKIPKRGNICSFNNLNINLESKYEKLSNILKSKNYKTRYVGSLVADGHRTLMEGGIFFYPENVKNPSGKLRLFYESIPFSYVFEKAGGMATNGVKKFNKFQSIDISPHVKTPLILSSEYEYKIYSML